MSQFQAVLTHGATPTRQIGLLCLQMQLQRAEPLPCKNGMSHQCADFFLFQQITCGFVLGSSHHHEDKWSV